MLDDQILDSSHEFKQFEIQTENSQQMKATIPITRTKIEDFLITMSHQKTQASEKKPQHIVSISDEIEGLKQFGKSKETFLDFQNFILEEFKLMYLDSGKQSQQQIQSLKVVIRVYLQSLADLSESSDELENEEKLLQFKRENQLKFKSSGFLSDKNSEESSQQLISQAMQQQQQHSLAFYSGAERLNQIQELLKEYLNQFYENLQTENQNFHQNYKKFEQNSISIFKIIELIIDDLYTMFLIFDKKSLETTLNNYDILGQDFAARIECKSNWWYKQEKFGINDQNAIKLSFAKVLEPEELKPSKDKLYHITVEKSYPDVFPVKLEKIYNLNMIKDQSHNQYSHQTAAQLLNSHSNQEKELAIPEYFHPKCRKKVLHYFEPGTRNLWTFDLEQLRLHLNKSTPPLQAYQKSLEKITLTDCNFVISPNYRSLITPTGKIYLCGGIGNEDDEFTQSLASKPKSQVDNSLFLYKKMSMDGDQIWTQSNVSFIGGGQNRSKIMGDKQVKHILQKKNNMNIARKYFGFAFLENHLYVVGGRTKSKKCTRSCERYGIETGMWKQIANLNEPVSSLTLCTFNDKYLFKFGGINIDGYPDKTIERYDPMQNNWWVVRYSCLNVDEQIELPVKALSSQINDKQILIFGGRNINGFKADNSYLFEINDEDKTVMSKTKLFGTIESVKEQLLLSYIGEFQENAIMSYKNSIYYLRIDNFS